MPKENWNPATNTFSVDIDPADPKEAAEIKKRAARGKSISGMTPQDMRDLLTALNERYDLGLTL